MTTAYIMRDLGENPGMDLDLGDHETLAGAVARAREIGNPEGEWDDEGDCVTEDGTVIATLIAVDRPEDGSAVGL